MAELERTKTITLVKPISDNSGKQTWEALDLCEPTLLQVQQFYDEQTKAGGLSAMGLLISLLSAVPREVIKKLAITDYKACEGYLLGFLNYSPTAETGGN
ncbi:phage tail assembly protein [Martelella alba]|uniref:Phage tail assembly protein n=1 Tax=Martelella alba TaxID=2590451 RepID=A0ABY2SEI8_9HYPH|nr:phage tail assembly protein [Martelella alba]TKI02897.1 phage tail assembly protein [Martelella alba]